MSRFKTTLLSIVFTLTLMLFPVLVGADSISDLQSQINQLNGQISQNQSSLNSLRSQANTLQNKVNQLNGQIRQFQQQIDLSNLQIEQTQAQINDAAAKLEKEKQIMFENAKTLYKLGSPTTIEILASSDNFTDFIDKQEYLTSVKQAIDTAAKQILALKSQLEQHQNDLQQYVRQQQVAQGLISSTRDQEAQLLAQTRGQESQYQSLLASQQAQVANLQAQEEEALRGLVGGSSGSEGDFSYQNLSDQQGCGTGGYPYCGAKDSYLDPWELYNRECVSYAAWAMSAQGYSVPQFNGQGNASEWPNYLARLGYTENTNPDGPYHSVVVIAPDVAPPYGHAMVVEKDEGNGWILVSQYNFDRNASGLYSTMEIRNSGVVFIHFD